VCVLSTCSAEILKVQILFITTKFARVAQWVDHNQSMMGRYPVKAIGSEDAGSNPATRNEHLVPPGYWHVPYRVPGNSSALVVKLTVRSRLAAIMMQILPPPLSREFLEVALLGNQQGCNSRERIHIPTKDFAHEPED
jgi:hypothetical protein